MLANVVFTNLAILGSIFLVVVIPIFIHLLNKSRPRRVDFSSLEHLKKAQASQSKLFKLRHLIYLILRTLALICLLIFFLKPILDMYNNYASKGKTKNVIILFDSSLSMHANRGGVSVVDRANAEAAKIIDSLNPTDNLAVVMAQKKPIWWRKEFSTYHSDALRFLQSQKVGYGRANIYNSINAIAAFLKEEKTTADIYIISDMQRSEFSDISFDTLPINIKLYFVDASEDRVFNRGINEISLSNNRAVLISQPVAIGVRVGNFGPNTVKERVELLHNGVVVGVREILLSPFAEEKIYFNMVFRDAGWQRVEAKISDDELLEDNRRFLAINVGTQEDVVIISDTLESSIGNTSFLQAALNPWDKGGTIKERLLRSTEITKAALAGVNKIFLTELGLLKQREAKIIADFIKDGGGCVYLLDGKYDQANCELLSKLFAPQSLPLIIGAKRLSQSVAGGAQQFANGNFRSPFLKIFEGQNRSFLARPRFYEFYSAQASGEGEVLLSFSDGTPAMAYFNPGIGTMLMANFSLSELSSTMARQNIFPAWMHEILRNLVISRNLSSGFSIDESVFTEVWKEDLKNNSIIDPRGHSLRVNRQKDGDRFKVSFLCNYPGFYSLDGNLKLFAANHNSSESDLRRVDLDLIRKRTKRFNNTYAVGGKGGYRETIEGRPLYHYFAFLALLFLALESIFGLILKGRVNR